MGVDVVDPPPLPLGELVEGESGMNGPTIAPMIKMNAMPPHPREVFFEATCSAYAVGVTLLERFLWD